jgi:hypothetical protein
MKKIKIIKADEIRTNYKKTGRTPHPTYIYAKEGKSYHFLGITHSPQVRGTKTIALHDNPNPKDKKQAFIIPKRERDHKKNFGPKHRTWKMSKTNKAIIKKIK